MNRITFTLRSLFALTLLVALALFFWPRPDPFQPDPAWRESLLAKTNPLLNVPEVELVSRNNGTISVTVTNRGKSTLEYRGLSESQISLYQEIKVGTNWQKDAWSVDGMCEGHYEIVPGESTSLDIEFWDDHRAVRMLGKFSEKGTDRAGLVVLATNEAKD